MLVPAAVREYLAKQTKISARRLRTVTSYLHTLSEGFGETPLHEVAPPTLNDFVDNRKWAAKTRNDFLGTVSLLCKEA